MLKITQLLTKIAIVAGSILLVSVVYMLIRSTPEKYYSKAVRNHKAGERKYLSGNYEGAEAAYMHAEELRKRARELE